MTRPLFLLPPLLLLAVILTGCRDTPAWRDSGQPAEARIVAARDLGPLRFDPGVRCRDGGYSGLWRHQSIWLFGDTVTTRPAPDGFNWRSNTACRAADLDAAAGNRLVFREYLDANGVPDEVLPFTPAERDFNRQHFTPAVPEKQRRRYALWPGPLVAAPDDRAALAFFSLIAAGSDGPWDFRSLGQGVAVWSDPDGRPGERRLLFPAGDIQLGNAAVRVGNILYAYGCEPRGLSWPVRLGRVEFDRALDRAAWTFYAGGGQWTADPARAVPVLDAAPMLSVHYNPYLRRYLAIYSVPLVNRLALRTAPSPEGPWSDPVTAAACLPPAGKDAWCYSGLGHGELARSGGQVEYLTYYRETGPFQGEIRLVEATFAPPETKTENKTNPRRIGKNCEPGL